jgi:uncharacterized protein involved in exopolysaccharide biosynthesis
MAAKYTNENPLLVQLRTQLAEARKIAAGEKVPSEVKSSVSDTFKATQLALQEREAQLVAINARVESLETQIARIESNLKKVNESEVALNRLERELALARANYSKYAENLEQARINQELEEAKITSLTLMQPPTYSETPVRPRPLFVLALGFAASTICGLGIAVLADGRQRHVVESTFAVEHPVMLAAGAPPAARRGELVPANPR